MPNWKEWLAEANAAASALATLKEMQDEFQEQYDNLSEKVQEGEKGTKLSAITDLDIDGAISIVDEILSVEKP